jgi:hypothetical protein
MEWDVSSKKGYFMGWRAAQMKLKQMLDNGLPQNRAAIMLAAHELNALTAWVQSGSKDAPPECKTEWKDDPLVFAMTRDIPSSTINITDTTNPGRKA